MEEISFSLLSPRNQGFKRALVLRVNFDGIETEFRCFWTKVPIRAAQKIRLMIKATNPPAAATTGLLRIMDPTASQAFCSRYLFLKPKWCGRSGGVLPCHPA